jgi:enterobactin synthetase component D / holo-[acyl-carrier protein] synthase
VSGSASKYPSGVIESLLPECVAAAHARTLDTPITLHEAERASLGAASPGRAGEFATGRACSRRALSRLGFAPAPITRGADREPRWPDGVVGSITHTRGYVAAAVARSDALAAIGIDAEQHDRLPAAVLRSVALPVEQRHIAALPRDETCWDRLLFSAKESVFKAWYPLTRRWLGFEDAIVRFDPPTGTFRASLLVPGPPLYGRPITAFRGRFLVADGLVLTAVSVGAIQRPISTQTFFERRNSRSPSAPPTRP